MTEPLRCRRRVGLVGVLALLTSLAIAFATPADARRHKVVRHSGRAVASSPTDPSKDAALIIDGTTGKVLYARNHLQERHPASLTKMMTLYLLFDAMKRGQVNLNTTIPISAHAAAQKPTNLHLRNGDQITVDIAIKALVIRSANDVAAAVAEYLGGTEGHFAELMTAKARALGMRNTFYHNASGLPDDLQITTAEDLSVLARHLAYDFPQYYHYFATPSFSFRGVEYPTHDNLIGRYRGADGIKTGYTGASGFNLVSSVVRDNAHIIGVVMGGRTAVKRDREMMRLLDLAFNAARNDNKLVARAQVPWQVALNTAPNPALANSGSYIALPGGPSEGDDEDTAERRADAEEIDDTRPTPPPPSLPKPQGKSPVVAALALPKAPIPTPAPSQPRTIPTTTQRPSTVAMLPPAPRPNPSPIPSAAPRTQVASAAPKPAMRPVILGEGDVGDSGSLRQTLGLHDWTIQIGAFADLNLARAQLAAYAEKAMDVLGQAQRIVVPFQSVDGHTLYRARFGPFAEREARQICARLTERGQTCFAAISSR
ncbi:D-alanyl-D-alanine carboxypeptidase [Rhizomicrobium electricum]|uniref:D-alanyl-D-alanine carboxypeptidase n=1 Tax=Rhizomicrobium electricum TaxID=480070 RepID=UPI00141FC0E9|nr:D-alanyl-D-alanine carboxypeptidase [Rhizomicrobium electricum]NIJ47401.1 D-alanyl-D-alanine carboxypeptidase [Rhizomicrobium electricum]